MSKPARGGTYAAITVNEGQAVLTVTATYSFEASGGRLCCKKVRSFLTASRTLVSAAPVDDRNTV